MKQTLAILLGRIIAGLTRKLKIGGGSAAPGLYALKIDSNLIEKLVGHIPKNIIITGTNGKTTTAGMVAHFAKASGLRIIRNHTGSNLARGIVSALIHKSSSINHNSFDLGIWELDEAAFNPIAPKINPDIVVFLNVFRDQLDRYGEINSIVEKWCETLKKLSPNTVVLLNGDDDNTLRLADCFKGKIETFGIENFKISGEGIEKKKFKQKLNFEAKNIKTKGLSGSTFQLTLNHKLLTASLSLPGIYHIYDAASAIACGYHLNLPAVKLINSLKSFQPAFGRAEKFELTPPGWRHKVSGYVLLIKNPAGATQVLETIAPQITTDDRLLLALNDDLADGTDISWIWDIEFDNLKFQTSQVVCSGTRADELAVRLKYTGLDTSLIEIEPDLKKAFKKACEGLKGKLFILPTYTAMLKLQKILTKSGIKKHYWEKE